MEKRKDCHFWLSDRSTTAWLGVTSVVIVGPSSRAAAETAGTADTEPAILREIVAVDMTTVIIRPEERLVLGF